MGKELRKTELNIIGDVLWGAHLCQFCQTREDLIDILVANRSLELRTPLNLIICFSELLKQKMAGELNEKQEHYVDNVLSTFTFLLPLNAKNWREI